MDSRLIEGPVFTPRGDEHMISRRSLVNGVNEDEDEDDVAKALDLLYTIRLPQSWICVTTWRVFGFTKPHVPGRVTIMTQRKPYFIAPNSTFRKRTILPIYSMGMSY